MMMSMSCLRAGYSFLPSSSYEYIVQEIRRIDSRLSQKVTDAVIFDLYSWDTLLSQIQKGFVLYELW